MDYFSNNINYSMKKISLKKKRWDRQEEDIKWGATSQGIRKYFIFPHLSDPNRLKSQNPNYYFLK